MFRRYESRLTRFSQPDPYEGSYDLADPQSFNRYAYVQNDPVNFTDPTGLEKKECNGVEVTDPATGMLVCIETVDAGTVTVMDNTSDEFFYRMFVRNSRFDGYIRHLVEWRERKLTGTEVSEIRGKIEQKVNGDCADFIDLLVSSATGSTYNSREQLMTDFDTVKKTGGFFFKVMPDGGTPEGSFAKGNARVNITSTLSDFKASRFYSGTAAAIALHELIHLLARAGDQTLSEIVRANNLSTARFPNPNETYSIYWNDVLLDKCFKGP